MRQGQAGLWPVRPLMLTKRCRITLAPVLVKGLD
jgi:hypothetical protein